MESHGHWFGSDIIGFVLVFAFGGFNIGVVNIVAEQSKSYVFLKFLGASLVTVGFALQICGAMDR